MRYELPFSLRSSKFRMPKISNLKTGLLMALTAVIAAGADDCYGQQGDPGAKSVVLRTLDDHIPFQVPESKDAWLKRREQLRDQLSVALGLVPQPKLVPLAANVYGAIEQEGFVCYKVTIETLPGFYLTARYLFPAVT